MQIINNLSLKVKLWLLVLSPILIVGVLLWTGYRSSQNMNLAFAGQKASMESLQLLSEVQLNINSTNLVAMDAIVDRESKKISDDLREEFSASKDFFNNNKTQIHQILADSQNAKENTESFKKIDNYLKAIELLFALVETGITENQVAEMDDAIDGAGGQLVEIISNVKAQVSEDAKAANQRALTLLSEVEQMNLWLSIVGLIAILASATPLIISIANELNRSASNLKSVTASIHDCTSQLNQASNSLSSATEQQAAAVQQTVSSMTEISAMIQQSAQSADQSCKIVEEIVEKGQSGQVTMREMAQAMQDIEQTCDELNSISQLISEIEENTKFINEIVFKTQMLSVNASIEAARAGQSGKGFAVVAEEVGDLAQKSGVSAEAIQNLVKNSKTQVENIISKMNSRVNIGKKSTDGALNSFVQIAEGIKEINNQATKIAQASKDQSHGVHQTTTAMRQVDEAAQSNKSATSESLKVVKILQDKEQELALTLNNILKLVNGHKKHSQLPKLQTMKNPSNKPGWPPAPSHAHKAEHKVRPAA